MRQHAVLFCTLKEMKVHWLRRQEQCDCLDVARYGVKKKVVGGIGHTHTHTDTHTEGQTPKSRVSTILCKMNFAK